MAGSSIMDTLFQRTLEDLIKGLRLSLIGETAFISKAMEEIRREIKSTDLDTKSTALQKLSYLNSLHFYDMSFASFHIVELMSSTKFSHKRIAYQSASQCFVESTPVLVLITNQLRKDLSSKNEFEVSLALECLSRIATVDLARDLSPEIFTLLGSSKVSVRKKAVAVTLRVFDKYPDAARVCFKRLVENVESSDAGVLSAAIGVFCELAARDPGSYLPLAPEFYRVFVDCKNNWVLIKVLKIFARLAPHEPRLAKRVVEPICDLMRRTVAKSLMFECVRTVLSSFSGYESAVRLAVRKVRELLVEDDPNLKYLALNALSIVAPSHMWTVLENKEIVIKSLSDLDPNIKRESLNLVMAMVSESNVAEISRVLLNYALKSDPEFCNEILGSILSTCCRNLYEIVVDFDWYVSILGEMSRVLHCQKGDEIERQLIDIGMRVRDVRPELVRVSRDLLIDPALLGNHFLHKVLSAAAWVSGEYVEFSRNPSELIEALLQPRTNLLPPSIKAVYIQSSFKVLVFFLHSYFSQSEVNGSTSNLNNLMPAVSEFVSELDCSEGSDLTAYGASKPEKQAVAFDPRAVNQSSDDLSADYDEEISVDQLSRPTLSVTGPLSDESVKGMLNKIELSVRPLLGSHDVEIIERARNLLCFIELIRHSLPHCSSQKKDSTPKSEAEAYKIIELVQDVFSDDLGPVSVTAQERVLLPAGLELKENLKDLETFLTDFQLPSSNLFSLGTSCQEDSVGISPPTLEKKAGPDQSNESTSLLAEHRKRHGMYYLPSEKNEASIDYPPANELKSPGDAEDLVKLTDQSLVSKKKSNPTKPRPVVVKLDGDGVPTLAKPQPKDDSLSEAVREALLGSDSKPNSSENKSHKGKEKIYADTPGVKEDLGVDKDDNTNPSSRKSKNQSHGRDKKHQSSSKVGDIRDENGQEVKKKSSHRHTKHKSRKKTDVVPQTEVIPDFLL